MKKIYLAVLIICISSFASAQNFAWARSFGGNNNDAGRVTCTDASGNIYVAGGYFAPSMLIGSVTLNSLGGGDVFLSKWDPNGNLVWVQNIGGTGLETVGGVCTSTNGNVFICGSYDSPVLTVSTATLGQNSSAGNHDIYVAQFSPSGSCNWTYRYGNTGNDVAKGITYSSALNNVIFTGYFNSSTIAFGTTTLTNTGTNYDVYVAKLTPSFFSATVAGAFSTGASNANDYGYSVRADATSIYLGGSFSPVTGNSSTIGGAVTSYGSQDVFLAKYSNANVFQWVRTGGSASSSADYFSALDIDANSNCYIVGAYYGLPMVIGTTTLTNGGTNDGFIAKYNSSGTLQWANKLSGASSEFNNDVTVDANNDAYVAGYYSSTVATSGTVTLSNPTSTTFIQNVYVIKYNGTSGAALWAATSTGTSQGSAYGITNDAIGNIYFTGSYGVQAPMIFGTTTLTSLGSNDGFLTRIHCSNPNITGASNVCTGSSATLIANGATSYTWSNGATTTSIVVTPTANMSFTIIGNSGACTSPNSTPFVLNLLPASVNAGPDFSLMCNATGVMNPTCNPANPTGIQWTPSTGLNSAIILSPTVTAPNNSVSYVLTCTLTNGCVGTDTITVSHDVVKPDICIVTCDSLNNNNEIFWDKLAYPLLDSMIIYREVSASIYKRIGAVPSNSISLFTDTVRSVGPSNGDPKITTYRYKIQVRDVCGAYGPMSLWHNTIYFTRSNSTFFWVNNYLIEGPTNPVNTYSLLVCPNPTVSPIYQLVGTTAGNQNQLNDPAYATYSATADWRVVGDLGYVCYAQKTAQQGKSTPVTRSNISNNRAAPDIGVKERSSLLGLNIYPNPAQKFVTIDAGSLSDNAQLKVVDALGKMIMTDSFNDKKILDVSGLAQGVYTLKINYKGSEYTHKLVIN
jgi:hypothetical protein